MGSPWRSKKAFLYFGGAIVILLGGAIVLSAPYNYIGYRGAETERMDFTLTDRPGYYPQLEISLNLNPFNATEIVLVDFSVLSNTSMQVYTFNFTLTADNMVPDSNPRVYVARHTIDVLPGDYTVVVDRADGTGTMDIGLTQISDSRIFIVTGGAMNILGLFMGGAGWFVSGAFLPTGDEMIVDWGYEEEEYENQ
ncbi:MAG: hypothetical protein ACW975_07090 [Candidatus Thorarchaeota archaeon]|jgi:hypothetical protein